MSIHLPPPLKKLASRFLDHLNSSSAGPNVILNQPRPHKPIAVTAYYGNKICMDQVHVRIGCGEFEVRDRGWTTRLRDIPDAIEGGPLEEHGVGTQFFALCPSFSQKFVRSKSETTKTSERATSEPSSAILQIEEIGDDFSNHTEPRQQHLRSPIFSPPCKRQHQPTLNRSAVRPLY